MERYIKINNSNLICDLFFKYQKNKFDGNEILLDDLPEKSLLINDKYISDENGNYIFEYDEGEIIEIDPYIDTDILLLYKLKKRDELYALMWPATIEGNRTLDDIITQWATFKANAPTWTTKAQVDAAFETAKTWLGF